MGAAQAAGGPLRGLARLKKTVLNAGVGSGW
jgi:hypothetical protein